MSISLWNNDLFDPFKEMRRIQRDLDRMWATTPSSSTGKDLSTSTDASFWRPRCDLKETDKNYIVHAELPGVPKDQIHIEVSKDGILTLSGERQQEKKEENEMWHRVERSWGKFTRSFQVPEGVKEDQIQAKYDNGVLELTFPKPEPKKEEPKKISIQ